MRSWQRAATAAVVLANVMGPHPARAQSVIEVQIAPPRVQLRGGEQFQVYATGYSQAGEVVVGQRFRWSSSDTSVVQILIDNESPEIGTLIAIGAGAAVIEARTGTARGLTTGQVTGSQNEVVAHYTPGLA